MYGARTSKAKFDRFLTFMLQKLYFFTCCNFQNMTPSPSLSKKGYFILAKLQKKILLPWLPKRSKTQKRIQPKAV